ncbi:hypothetical protein Tco_0686477 [Tanacetum coccineum]
METTDKRNTDKDCIVDSNSAMSIGNQKLVQIRQKGKERGHVEADHALAFDQSFLASLTWMTKLGDDELWNRRLRPFKVYQALALSECYFPISKVLKSAPIWGNHKNVFNDARLHG